MKNAVIHPAKLRFWDPRRPGGWAEYIRLGYFWVPGRGYIKHRYVPPLVRNGRWWIRCGYWIETGEKWIGGGEA